MICTAFSFCWKYLCLDYYCCWWKSVTKKKRNLQWINYAECLASYGSNFIFIIYDDEEMLVVRCMISFYRRISI